MHTSHVPVSHCQQASHELWSVRGADVLQEVERVVGWDPAEGGDGGGNLTGIPVLLRPNDKATERAALQRLKDLAPLALFSEDKSRAAVAPRLAGTGGWGERSLHLKITAPSRSSRRA